MATRRGGDMSTTEYLSLVRVIKAELGGFEADISRVLGMFKNPVDHNTRLIQHHMLVSLVGRRKGWADRFARITRLLIEAEKLSLELE